MEKIYFISAPGKKRLKPINFIYNNNNNTAFIDLNSKIIKINKLKLSKIKYKFNNNFDKNKELKKSFSNKNFKNNKKIDLIKKFIVNNNTQIINNDSINNKSINIINLNNIKSNEINNKNKNNRILLINKLNNIFLKKYYYKFIKKFLYINNLNIFSKILLKKLLKFYKHTFIKILNNNQNKIKNEYIITIQSFIRRFIIYKKIKLLKNKIIIIQKNSRLFLIKKKYFKELSKIKENIEFNKRKKNFNQNMKLMKIKKEAISVIEKYWSKVLLKRENNFINNKNNDNDDINNCKDLYQKFIILRKQTNNLKRDLIDFTKKEKEKDKQREIEIEKEREKFKLNYKIKLN